MRAAIIAMALVLAVSVANAAQVFLSCTGTIETLLESRESRDAYSITVDIENKRLTANNQELPIYVVSGDTIYAGVSPSQGTSFLVELNRVTGKVSVSIVLPILNRPYYVQTFDGTCKPGQKLF